LGVQVLITGHSHELKVSQYNGHTFINPGSITGAYSCLKINPAPSFMVLEFKKENIIVYEYSLVEGELRCADVKV
jgi:vacuolar protein sorting-associated protein 29